MAHGNSVPHRNIVLAGFMGTGKTTVGRLVAERLGWRFVDTDDVITARDGRVIAAIFEQDGEATFRQLESAACRDMAALCHQVIATGGGALLDPRVSAAFAARSVVICLTCDLDEIIRRVGDDPARPLFVPDRDRLARLLAARADHYARLPHHVDTTHSSPAQAAEEVIRLWEQNR
jgi:shikimate kinase